MGHGCSSGISVPDETFSSNCSSVTAEIYANDLGFEDESGMLKHNFGENLLKAALEKWMEALSLSYISDGSSNGYIFLQMLELACIWSVPFTSHFDKISYFMLQFADLLRHNSTSKYRFFNDLPPITFVYRESPLSCKVMKLDKPSDVLYIWPRNESSSIYNIAVPLVLCVRRYWVQLLSFTTAAPISCRYSIFTVNVEHSEVLMKHEYSEVFLNAGRVQAN